ncbi:MAG: Pectate lyase [Acidobacteria bacterium]|nr:Pectate lyase [Acidobacteriota bacterium]
MLCGPNHWKVLSGTWRIQGPQEVLYLQAPERNTGENIAVIGSHNWAGYELEATVSILGKSIKPPEGGAILYYHFRNPKNYCSLHLCISKGKLEVIKRFRGEWSILAEREFFLETQRKYQITIRTGSAIDTIRINSEIQFEIHRQDIPAGCVGVGIKYCDVVFARLYLTNSSQPA